MGNKRNYDSIQAFVQVIEIISAVIIRANSHSGHKLALSVIQTAFP